MSAGHDYIPNQIKKHPFSSKYFPSDLLIDFDPTDLGGVCKTVGASDGDIVTTI